MYSVSGILTTHRSPGTLMLDLADYAEHLSCIYGDRPPPLPGHIITHLSQEMRDILKNLKSDDLRNARYPLYM